MQNMESSDKMLIYALIAAVVIYTMQQNPAYGNAFQGYSNATGNILSTAGGNLMGMVAPGAACEPNWVALALSFGAGFYANRNLTPAQRQQIDDMLP